MLAVLLDRERELAEIGGLIEAARAGFGGVAVLEGPAGIGKTRLLGEAARVASLAGIGVLRARGSEFEAEIPFGVARQLFEPMLRTASASERHELLDGVASVGARAPAIEKGEPPSDRLAAIHGLFWLCANRADRSPVVVLVDDAQWVDDPSLAWLGYVSRRLAELPLVLVLGLRSGDADDERPELVQLVHDGPVHRLALAPLSTAAVGAIVRDQLDEGVDEAFLRGPH